MTSPVVSPRRVIALALSVFLLACAEEPSIPEQDAPAWLSDAFCEQVFACSCMDSAGFSSYEACRVSVQSDLTEQQRAAVDGALVFDERCLQRSIDQIEALACGRDPTVPFACDACFTYHGLLPEGEQCQRVGIYSTCNQGLLCEPRQTQTGGAVDVCVPACDRVRKGGTCSVDGNPLRVTRVCDEGLVCDSEGTQTCIGLPTPGQFCWEGFGCAEGAWCDTSVSPSICAALKIEGAGCQADLECASSWCRASRCAEPLVLEASCNPEIDRCRPGLECPVDVAIPKCTLTDALVCQFPGVAL